jgi:hypothetical protein
LDFWFISNSDATITPGGGRDTTDTAGPAGEPQLSFNDVNL